MGGARQALLKFLSTSRFPGGSLLMCPHDDPNSVQEEKKKKNPGSKSTKLVSGRRWVGKTRELSILNLYI